MPSANITGIALNGGTVNAPGNERNSEGTYFNQLSTSDISALINIHESPRLIRAFNLGESDYVEVLQVTKTKTTELQEPLVINGIAVKLTSSNNALLLDLSGYYRLKLTAESPLTVTVVGHDSSLSYWSYGLAAFVQTAP